MRRISDESLRKRLAKAIWEAGSKDPETIADYLIKNGWRPAKPTITFVNSLPMGLGPEVINELVRGKPTFLGRQKN